ncbi:acyl-CoA dehydrogenase [Nocardiopsis sp. NPDC006198]|uniref:acyl-CoA dehydrogenase family protein n=1 Tax=Nocardiopsis sp. NPDC006198 TaxID=3154472 RepID=UPI0033A21FB4
MSETAQFPPPSGTGAAGPPMAVADMADHLNRSEAFTSAFNARLDEAEEFPREACLELDRIGVPHYYVPRDLGGRLDDYTDLVEVIRTVSRKDLTVAIAHVKTFLGGAPSWLAAEESGDGRSAAQARRLADRITGGAAVSWGLTEPGRGSDLLAGQLTAEPVSDGYRLDGRKWPVNNATRSDLLCLLARTGPRKGPRDFTLLMADKNALAPGSYSHLPKARTVGIRGADISGIVFDGAIVPEENTVGPAGSGFELVLKAFQLTRTICAGLSLGAADHALHSTWDFVGHRRLYGRFLAELPHVRTTLGAQYAACHAAEALTSAAARAVRSLPGEMSVYSAVVKALVPEIVDEVIAECGQLLGARAFLREELDHGSFQKLERDHRIVGIFDGNRYVNRQALIRQFPRLVACWNRGDRLEAGVRAATGADEQPPGGGRLQLVSRTGCSLVQALPGAVEGLRASGASTPAIRSAERVLDRCERLHQRLARYDTRATRIEAELFDAARSYELCVAASAVIHMFLTGADRRHTDTEFGELRLQAALLWILSRLDGHADDEADRVYGAVADSLEARLAERDRLPSLLDNGEEHRR